MAIGKITKQAVDALKAAPGEFLWDTTLRGFGVRISKTGKPTYIVQYRTTGGRSGTTRRITIGSHGAPWTADTARQQAKHVLGRASIGEDPAAKFAALRRAMTVAKLCEVYLKEGTTGKKASTLSSDIGRINRHIIPLLGHRRVIELKQMHLREFIRSVARGDTAVDEKTKPRGRAIVTGGRGVATRTLGLLGAILNFAIELEVIDHNPARGVRAFAEKKRERFLSIEELTKLGDVLSTIEADGTNGMATNIIRLLILTGARRGEIDKLTWEEVDLVIGRINFADSKTGKKSIPLNASARSILSSLYPRRTNSPFVFPSTKDAGHYKGTPKLWRKVRALFGDPTLRIHDLRHSFASIAVAQGTPLLMVSKLLGHASITTTQRYAHLADDPIRAASEAVGSSIRISLYKGS